MRLGRPAWCLLLAACFHPSERGKEPAVVEIGIPDALTGLEFETLDPGGDIPLETFGQGGTHVSLAIRCFGLGERAFVDITLRNLDGEGEASSRPMTFPSLLHCRNGPCDLLPPPTVSTGGLSDQLDMEGLHIEVEVSARNEQAVMANARVHGYLKRR